MLNKSVLSFDAGGRIRNTLTAPTHFTGGVGFVGVLLSQIGASPNNFHNGQPYTDDQLSVAPAAAIDHYAQGGLPITAGGSIAISINAAVAYFNSGLPFSADGRLALATAE